MADNQNHSIILLKWTYQNKLQKIEYHFSINIFVCVSQAIEFVLLESGRQFSKESKILGSKETVQLRRSEGETLKFSFIKRFDKGLINTLKGLKADGGIKRQSFIRMNFALTKG